MAQKTDIFWDNIAFCVLGTTGIGFVVLFVWYIFIM